MVRAIPVRILRQILLVVVGAEAFSRTEITELSRRGQSTGRLSVDVDVDPPVDQTSVRSEQCPSLTRRYLRVSAVVRVGKGYGWSK
jgi:hypothetical protein